MSVSILHGDLFESKMQTLTNAINCVGVMGAGIALGFADRFPIMLQDYQERCDREEVRLSEPYLFVDYLLDKDGKPYQKNVLNFPTMYYPGEQASLHQILLAFDHVIEKQPDWQMKSLAVPALGCGIGGLLFDDVVGPFAEKLEKLEIPVELYAPNERALGNPYGGKLKVTIEPTQRS